jgi:DHA1 family bicyclomycin/chloramphenicol resistance-like MFS transporter
LACRIFGLNAFGIIAASQLSRMLVGRLGPARVMAWGVVSAAVGGVGLLIAVLGHASLPGILPPMFVAVASAGMVMPNATAAALADHARSAGSALALLGMAPFLVGAAVAPLVGIAGANTAVPMAVVIAVVDLVALAACVWLGKRVSGEQPDRAPGQPVNVR